MIYMMTNDYEALALPETVPVELDMGCGKGRMALELAKRYPGRLVLASDVMLGRLRKVEARRERLGLKNLWLLRADNAKLAAYQLPPQRIARIHLLCPDAWDKDRPKDRGRRLICTAFLCKIRRLLTKGGILHLSTDHPTYFNDWLDMFAAMPFYRPLPEALDDIRDIKTDFELQWLAMGKQVRHLSFQVVDS
jgi:tRNA (guanine-N7-)-methyltransferase